MANGFTVKEIISSSPDKVWRTLTDFNHAHKWMRSIDRMSRPADGVLEIGTILKFRSRGKDRETRVTALEPGRKLALTSTQGGVTATYEYLLAPAGDGTEITLNAACEATGVWKLVHPLIVVAMKAADSTQLSNLKAMIERDI